uniref:Uncharacterized protein n=1 Tax=Manihot esculenta TaxID=3983 RepID=A0A2C9VB49_MANES
MYGSKKEISDHNVRGRERKRKAELNIVRETKKRQRLRRRRRSLGASCSDSRRSSGDIVRLWRKGRESEKATKFQ